MSGRFLKSNVAIQPAILGWYAGPHLIAPATCAMNLANRYLKIMKSYVQAPQAHAAACRNSKLLGGPFLDLGGGYVAEVRALVERTTQTAGALLEFAGGIGELFELLRREARGESLIPLYDRVPQALRGYVELVYDLNHGAGVRFLEPLLYQSALYRPDLQSFFLREIAADRRPFAFATPLLPDAGQTEISVRLADSLIDDLYRARREPACVAQLAESFRVSKEAFEGYFTDAAPHPCEPYDGTGVRLRYFGHACVLLESRETRILVDPLIAYPSEGDISRFTLADLPDRIDYALITHAHQDHTFFETLIELRHRIGVVVIPRGGNGALQDPSLRLVLLQLGFQNVRELDVFEAVEIPGGRLIGLPFLGEHCDLDIPTKLVHMIELLGCRFVFAADAADVEPRMYEQARHLFGPADVLFLGMECEGAPMSWLYGSLFPGRLAREVDQSRRASGSNYEMAIQMVDRLDPKQLFIYALGQEPWMTFLSGFQYEADSVQLLESNRLIEECGRRGLAVERLYGRRELVYEGKR